jgi:LPXTG-motif cell wall-anchored protein
MSRALCGRKIMGMYLFNNSTASSGLYLFTTHITRNKIIAFVAVGIVAIAAVVWFLRRRRQSQA